MAEPRDPLDSLDADERAELVALRREVAALRTPATRRWRARGRAATAVLLLVLGCLLAVLTLVAEWAHTVVSNTDRFVVTVAPLIREPSVRAAVTDRVTDTIFQYVHITALADQALDALRAQGLPPALADRLHAFTGPLETGTRGFVHSTIGELVASDQFAAAWDQAIRIAHREVVDALSGNPSALRISGDTVVLDLNPFLTAAKRQLAAAGFGVVSLVPDVHPTVPLMNAGGLVRARAAYRLLDTTATWLPWITLLVLASGVYAARDRRRAIRDVGVGIALGMLVLAVGLLVVRGVLVASVPSRAAEPAGAVFDVLVRFLRTGLRAGFALGSVVALGAVLTGRSATAVRIRATAVEAIGWLRRHLTRSGRSGDRVGDWVHTHRVGLRAGAVLLAVLTLVFTDQPTGPTILLIAVLLIACLGVIQFLDAPRVHG